MSGGILILDQIFNSPVGVLIMNKYGYVFTMISFEDSLRLFIKKTLVYHALKGDEPCPRKLHHVTKHSKP